MQKVTTFLYMTTSRTIGLEGLPNIELTDPPNDNLLYDSLPNAQHMESSSDIYILCKDSRPS